MFPLEIRQLDMKLAIKEKIRKLDIAVNDAPRMDPCNGLGSLSTPGYPLLE
jgi:hypothetical protein